MTFEHRTTRLVRQSPEVVHARLSEFAHQVKSELVPFKRGDRFGQLLGVSGDVGLEIRERGQRSIEVSTLRGRIRVTAGADLEPTLDGETTMTARVAVTPHGPVGRLILGAARRLVPDYAGTLVTQVETMTTDLATELSKPDPEWRAKLQASAIRA